MTPRWATFGVFFVNGAVIGTWVGHIAWVQERFDFSKSTLGLVILAMAIGVIVALPIMGQAIVRLGSVRSTRITGVICALVLPLPLLAPEPWLLPLALIVLGASSGAMDVSMNAHGVAVERVVERPDEGEDAVKSGDLEGLHDRLIVADDDQAAAALLEPAMGSDQHAKAR